MISTLDAREVSLPLATVASLEVVLRDASPRLLTDLGQENGERLSEVMQSALAQDPATLSSGRFWDEVRAFFRSRGWANLVWEQPHPGVGLVRGRCEGAQEFPTHFFAATLEGFLSSILGTRVAVVAAQHEDADGNVTFAVASPVTIAKLRAHAHSTVTELEEALRHV